MSKYNKTFGAYGEQLAVNYLTGKKYQIIGRNARTPFGEIDIIAKDGETTVFVEVKTRSSDKYGTGLEAITSKKLNTMLRCAEFYCVENHITNDVRIDVISVETFSSNQIIHIKGAM